MKEKIKGLFSNHKINYILVGILGVIIGGGIFGTLGIVATTNKLEAKYVMYTKDGKTMTVQDAIKDLYVKASKGNNQTLAVGTANIEGFKITIPYTGDYPVIRCVYGTDENYGSLGTVSGNTCVFTGSSNTTYYYKLVATDNNGKIYEYSSSSTFGSGQPLSVVNVGDYIYMKPTSTSYSIPSSMTGCVSGAKLTYSGAAACGGIDGASQTINPSELTVWRVIRKNSDGTIDVVSENVSSTNVYFYGQTGYQKFIGTLNTIASQYTSPYVQSTRHMGYDGQQHKI